MLDAALGKEWLLNKSGNDFVLLTFNSGTKFEGVKAIAIAESDISMDLRQRYLANSESAVYLIRPDQHVAARWISPTSTEVENALERALGRQ